MPLVPDLFAMLPDLDLPPGILVDFAAPLKKKTQRNKGEFREEDHPRGQPGNAGQFGPSGGSGEGGGSGKPTRKPKRKPKPPEEVAVGRALFPDLPSKVQRSHDEAVAKLDALPKDREHGITIDAITGDVLAEDSGPVAAGLDWTQGEGAEVRPPWDLVSEGRRIIHLHTHMDEKSSFSDGDWGFFASKSVAQMTVITRDRICTLRKSAEYMAAPRSKFTPRDLKEAWNEELLAVEAEDTISADSLSDQTALMIEEVNRRLAKRFGFEYSSEPKGF